MPAHKIRTTDLDDLYLGLIKQKGLSPATVRQVHATIRRAMSQAVRWGWIATNPAANTTPPRVTKSDISPPELEDVQRLLQAANETYPEFGRLLHLAITTGARRGELCALRWERIDFDAAAAVLGGMMRPDIGQSPFEAAVSSRRPASKDNRHPAA